MNAHAATLPAHSARPAFTGTSAWLGLAGWLALCVGGGSLGSLVTDPGSAWYLGLDKPSWNPPRQVFGPMWTTLYVLMGVSVWRIWRRRSEPDLVKLFVLHLIPNFAWSFLFFGARQIQLALVDILLLWVLLVTVVVQFWRVDRVAGALLVPYLLWVSFASALNAEIMRLNW